MAMKNTKVKLNQSNSKLKKYVFENEKAKIRINIRKTEEKFRIKNTSFQNTTTKGRYLYSLLYNA